MPGGNRVARSVKLLHTRMEQIAKERGCLCVISAEVASDLARDSDRLKALPQIIVNRIAEPTGIYEYRPGHGLT
jgi:class 3 adenylate cyclase